MLLTSNYESYKYKLDAEEWWIQTFTKVNLPQSN